MTRATFYPSVWQRGFRVLPEGINPDSLVTQREAARICGVSSRTMGRHRRAGTGPTALPKGTCFGNAVRYAAWQVIAWRNRIVGTGPTSLDEIGAAWLGGLETVPSCRAEPRVKPAGCPAGVDFREFKRRFVRDLHLRLALADLRFQEARYRASSAAEV